MKDDDSNDMITWLVKLVRALKYAFMLSSLILLSVACTKQDPTLPPLPASISVEPLNPPATATLSDELPDLDLREANIIAVSFKELADGDYRFDVTLQHDDEGEAPNYADYWQVEDLQGNVLGQRILTHSHTNVPFTRSQTISIPDGITQVIVRGHDMNHGFGGQAMIVDLLSGETVALIDESSDQ